MASQPKSKLRVVSPPDAARKSGGALPTHTGAAADLPRRQGLKPVGLSFAAVLERARPQ